jgi:hypothetical protein
MIMQESVEFVGGPYDGYRHQLSFMPAGIYEQAALPVNENLIRAVTGEQHGPLLPCHRVAVYKLQHVRDAWQYHFVEEMITEASEPESCDHEPCDHEPYGREP